MRFTKQNTGLTFTRGGKKVDLHFDAMRASLGGVMVMQLASLWLGGYVAGDAPPTARFGLIFALIVANALHDPKRTHNPEAKPETASP